MLREKHLFDIDWLSRKSIIMVLCHVLIFFIAYGMYGQRFVQSDLQPKLSIEDLISPKKITLSCHVTIDPNIPAPRRMFIETYKNSPLHIRISYHTDHASSLACTNSLHVEFILNDRRLIENSNLISSNILDKKRYGTGQCFTDENGLLSRRITVNIDPVSNFDFTWWRCMVETLMGKFISSPEEEGDLLTPYGIYHDSPLMSQYDKFMNLHLLVEKKDKPVLIINDGYLPLSCALDNKSTIYTPSLEQYPQQPWHSFQFKLQEGEKVYAIETDMFERLEGHVNAYQLKTKPILLSCFYKSSCLDEEYAKLDGNDQTNNLLWNPKQCTNYTLFVSPETSVGLDDKITVDTTIIHSFFDYGHEFDSKCTFEDDYNRINPYCSSYPKTPVLDIEIRDKVIFQLPSASGYKCFPIFNTPNPINNDSKQQPQYKLLLCPDFPLYVDLYTEILDSMRIYRRMKVKFIEQSFNSKGWARTSISCGFSSQAKAVYITSGSCEKGETFCGLRDGSYSVRTAYLDNGASKTIEKKHNITGKLKNNIMTCMWKMYFCFYGVRVNRLPPSELVLLEDQRRGDDDESHDIHMVPSTSIFPNMCPPGEHYKEYKYDYADSKHESKVNVGDMIQNLKKSLYEYVDRISQTSDEPFLQVHKNVSTEILKYQNCPCQTRPSTCPSETLENHLFSTSVLFSQMRNIDPEMKSIHIWCEAFGMKSKNKLLSDIVTEYLCQSNMPDHVIRQGSQLLPEPTVEVYPYHGFTDNIIISCTNIPDICLHTSSPVVSIVFWNSADTSKILQSIHHFHGPIKQQSEMCVPTNGGELACNSLVANSDNDIFVLSSSYAEYDNISGVTIVMKRSRLNEYTHVKCNYALGTRESQTFAIDTALNMSMEMCKEHDYNLQIARSKDRLTVMCEVSYSQQNGTCRVPIVSLEVKERSTMSVLSHRTCNMHRSIFQTGCIFETQQAKKVTTILKPRFLLDNDMLVMCSYIGINSVNKTEKIGNLSVTCLKPVSHFVPKLVLVHHESNQSVSISCGYEALNENTCPIVSFVRICLYIDIGSMFLKKHSVLLAQRIVDKNHNIKCISNFWNDLLNCTISNPPETMLLNVTLPYMFPHFRHIAMQPSPSIQVYCVLEGSNTMSIKHYMGKTLQKTTNILLEQNAMEEEKEEHFDEEKPTEKMKVNYARMKSSTTIAIASFLIISFIFILTCGIIYHFCCKRLRISGINNKPSHVQWKKIDSPINTDDEENIIFIK